MAKQDYIQANRDWLAKKSQESGVKEIAKGIFYKVIKKGKNDGCHPNLSSVVTVHYTGWTINGKKFDSSRGGIAPAFSIIHKSYLRSSLHLYSTRFLCGSYTII